MSHLVNRAKEAACIAFDRYALGADSRRVAMIALRDHPTRALTCYRAIAASLRPHLPAAPRSRT